MFSKSVIDAAHGGEVWLSSRPSPNATFFFFLFGCLAATWYMSGCNSFEGCGSQWSFLYFLSGHKARVEMRKPGCLLAFIVDFCFFLFVNAIVVYILYNASVDMVIVARLDWGGVLYFFVKYLPLFLFFGVVGFCFLNL